MQNSIPKMVSQNSAANIRFKWNYIQTNVKSLLKVDIMQPEATFIGVLQGRKRDFNRVKNAEYRF